MNKICLDRTGLVITKKCDLKCKLCAGYIPYYDNPQDMDADKVLKLINKYFCLVEHVHDFSVLGGEPLIHPDLDEILGAVLNYGEYIDRILVDTSATRIFNQATIDVMKESKYKDKILITISNYGELSKNCDELVKQLESESIPFRVFKYSGEKMHCDGWVDFGDNSRKFFTQQETDEHAKECVYSRWHYNFYIQDGYIYPCGRCAWRIENNVYTPTGKEKIDILDESITDEQKVELMGALYNSPSTQGCAYCNGCKSTSERFPPAEQLNDEAK